jgi:hypothetical protein
MSTHSRSEKRQALQQLCATILALLVVVVLWAWRAHAPADKSRLRVPVAELHSQAAELDFVRRVSLSGRLFAHFMREHVRQLGADSAVSFEDLSGLRPERALEATHDEAMREGLALERAFADFDIAPTASFDSAHELRARLATLEHGLEE